jgi:hypothetical protein
MRVSLLSLTMMLISAMSTVAAAQARTKTTVDRRVIALREATVKPNVSAADFERYFADSVAGPLNRHIPGIRAYLLKGERGARVGGYVIVFEFVSLDRRNAYFPTPDTTSARYQQLAKALPPNAIENLARYVDIPNYTDYVVVR